MDRGGDVNRFECYYYIDGIVVDEWLELFGEDVENEKRVLGSVYIEEMGRED